MALTVGTDSYLSLADANTYWSNRDNDVWSAASDTEKEAALREATQFIDATYEFIGYQVTTNSLAFPRNDVYITKGNFAGVSYDNTTIPPQIEDACAELALEALSDRLLPSKDRGGAVKREKVDVIEVEYFDWAPSARTFNYVARILRPLLTHGGAMKGLVRS